MSIHLVTAPPGSGKTLYVVSTLIGKYMKATDTPRRLCVDGIPDLLMEHELISSPWPVDKIDKREPHIRGEGNGVWNWFEWCKPGDLIVIDEVQRHWRPRGMGQSVPPEIAALETHRHKGVDFIIITQSATLVDQNVRRLVSPHTHVRRMFGGARAMLYEWDMAQTEVRGATAMKTFWSYPKDAYKLYKSSELHTKQQQKTPLFMYVPIVAGVALLALAPKVYSSFRQQATGDIQASSKEATKNDKPQPGAPAPGQPPGGMPPPPEFIPPFQPIPQAQQLALVAGCFQSKRGCECFDAQSRLIDTGQDLCKMAVSRTGFLTAQLQKPDEQPAEKQTGPQTAAPLGVGGSPPPAATPNQEPEVQHLRSPAAKEGARPPVGRV